MKTVRLFEFTGIEGLRIVEEASQTLGRNDVRVRVRAASLNFRDTIIVSGHYPGALGKNVIPLSDGAGDVIAVGEAVTRFQVGDRVTAACNPRWIAGPMLTEYHFNSIGITTDGMLSEETSVDEGGLVRIPDGFSYAEAASLPCAAVSAWSALNVQEPLRPGHTVLVQGTGGVALFALQLARACGARVLAITSSAERADLLREMGASAVINYVENVNWDEAILDLTQGQGVDKVVEIAGEKTIQRSVACTRIGGELGLVGFVSGFGGGLPPLDIMKRSVTLQGISIGPRRGLEQVIATLDGANMRPKIGGRFDFEDYASAYRFMQRGSHVGKVIIDLPS